MTTLKPLAAHQEAGLETFFRRATAGLLRLDEALNKPAPTTKRGQEQHTNALYRAFADPDLGDLLAWAPGAGKTRTGLTAAAGWRSWLASLDLKNQQLRGAMLRPWLVVARANGVHVWGNELHKWFPMAPAGWVENPLSGREITAAVARIKGGESKVLAISYSLLAAHIEKLDGLAFSVGVFDEVHALCNPQTQRAQAVYRLARVRPDGLPGILLKLALSGTPFAGDVLNLWPVLALLHGYALPVKPAKPPANPGLGMVVPAQEDAKPHYVLRSPEWGTRAAFEQRYSRMVGVGKRVPIDIVHDPRTHLSCLLHRPENCPHLHPRLLRTGMHRVTADEAWKNLPQIDPLWVPVELGKTQMGLYKRLVEEEIIPAVNQRGGGYDVAVSRLALMTYAFEALASTRQLEYSAIQRGRAGLQLPGNRGHESALLKHILELDEEIGPDEPLIVYTFFKQFAQEIASNAKLAHRKPLLLAGNSGLTNRDAERIFQSGGSNLLVATAKGFEAMTLTRARVMVLAGFVSWSPFDLQQAMYRIRRPGQEATRLLTYCTYVPGTLLDWLRSKLAHKLEYGTQALDGRAGGADDLGLGHMTQTAFIDAFWGR